MTRASDLTGKSPVSKGGAIYAVANIEWPGPATGNTKRMERAMQAKMRKREVTELRQSGGALELGMCGEIWKSTWEILIFQPEVVRCRAKDETEVDTYEY